MTTRMLSHVAAATLVALSFGARGAVAQHDHDAHSHPAPEKLGTVGFANSCSAAAQPALVRGLALLHSFGYEEAVRSFDEAAAEDPGCAMAQWGLAMSQFHAIWAPPTEAEFSLGARAAKRAGELAAARAEARERDWIQAVQAVYAGGYSQPNVERARAFEAAMAKVAERHPQDDEAAIFHALGMLSVAYNSPPDKTYAGQKRAAALLNGLLSRHSDHPGVAHYMIHSFDYPALASLAEDAARAYAKIAPDSSHALHMPSHIFTRLGLWQESIDSNLASAAAGERDAARTHPGAASYNALHAMDYLAYAYLQTGRDEQARQIVAKAAKVEAIDVPNFAAGYALAAIPARYALERRDWGAAAALTPRPSSFAWAKQPYAEAVVHFARAVGAARGGQLDVARAAYERLAAIRAALAAGPKAGFDWATQVEIQRLAAEGWLRQAEGKSEEAERLLRSSADLEDTTDKHPVTPGSVLQAREQLADLLLERSKAAAALAEYKASLETAPARFRTVAGAAQAAERAGDKAAARDYAERLTALCGDHGAGRAELMQARRLLASR